MDGESAQTGGDTSVLEQQTQQTEQTDTQTTGSEAENNSSEAMVPSHRVREATEARREAEARAEKAERELEQIRQQQSSKSEDDDIDPEVMSLVKKIVAKEGYVKKDEVEAAVSASELKRQYDQDVSDLTSKYSNSGVPFKSEDIRNFAKENGINITNKASLEAAYRQMNFDKILEAQKNAAITAFKENGNGSSAEKPGSEGAKAPTEEQPKGLKNRISFANKRLRQ